MSGRLVALSLKSAMKPQVLLRVLENTRFEFGVNAARVNLIIAARKAFEHGSYRKRVAAACGISRMGKHQSRRIVHACESACCSDGCRLYSKEGDKHRVPRAVILVGGKPEGVAVFEATHRLPYIFALDYASEMFGT